MKHPLLSQAKLHQALLLSSLFTLLLSPVFVAQAAEMETTIITASRIEQKLDDTLAPVFVMTREDIERAQAKDIAELLAQVPGIVVSQDGSKGSSTSIFMRGTNNDHTLFLVDGQRFSSATLGETAIQFLDPEQIERIEIVRGPRSTLYGSEAIGGVIQIFTKNGKNSAGTYIRTGAGSNNSWQLAAGTRGKSGNTNYAVNVSTFDTRGFDSYQDITPPNDDDDGYQNTAASLSFGHEFADDSSLAFSFLYSDSDEEHDGTFSASSPYSKHLVQTASLSYNRDIIADFWATTIMLGNSIDESNQRDHEDIANESASDFETTRDSILWQNDISFNANHVLSLGIEYYDDQVESTTDYTDRSGTPVESRDNTAIFAAYQANLNQLDIQLGLREDDNEEFGTTTTANIAAGYAINEQHKVILSYGEGFKAPTFNDLYWPIGAYSYGNPDLVPESSKNYELELRGTYDNLQWSANIYRNDIDNLIDWAPDETFAYTPTNIASVEIKGIELAASTEMSGWKLRGSINYNQPEDTETGYTLVKRPEKSAAIELDKSFNKTDFGISWKASSERYKDAANTTGTAGFGLVNLRIAHQITDDFKAQVKLNNVFDKDYQTNLGYNQDGFNWFVTLTYSL